MAKESKARRSLTRALQSKIEHKKALQAADTSEQPSGINMAVAAYFGDPDVMGSKPLSRERELELCRLIQGGSLLARDELTQANLRFVIDVARHFQNRGLPLDDLIATGNTGLIEAAVRFDAAKGYKFITYAVWWIRQAILKALAGQNRTVPSPVNVVQMIGKIAKKSPALAQKLGHEPSAFELSTVLKAKVDDVQRALAQSQAMISLDEPIPSPRGGNTNRLRRDGLSDEGALLPDQELQIKESKATLLEAIRCLADREQEVLRLYFGLDGEEPMTLEKIGARFKLTRERVRQIKEKALARLRHPAHATTLEEAWR
ncbi:MAG: RNA polymerase sigma factor RpoD/SigA [Patescibacteria group bacterium]